MGLKVTAAEAAHLVDRHERIVRWHVKRGTLPATKVGHAWAIDVDDLERVPGWHVSRDRLAELQARDARTAESLVARVSGLEREVRDLRARIRTLELGQGQTAEGAHGNAPVARYGANLVAQGATGYQSAAVPFETPRNAAIVGSPATPAPYTMRHTDAATPATFRSRTDAARWLVRHGIASEATPKTWPGWREVALDKIAVLRLAQSVYNPRNWRITWRLHECDDPTCVCHETLGV